MSLLPTREQPTHLVRGQGVVPRGPVRAPSAAGLTGRDVLRILRERKWLILLSVLICLAIATVVSLLWAMYAPLYTADAFLLVNPPRGSELAPTTGLYGKEIMDRLLMSAAQLARRRDVLNGAITGPNVRSQDLRDTDWFKRDRDGAVTRLEKEISLTPHGNTNLLRVSFTEPIAREAAVVANAVAQAAADFSKSGQGREIADSIQSLDVERRALEEEIATVAAARARPMGQAAWQQEQAEVARLEREQLLATVKLQSLQTELAKLELARSQAEGARDAVVNLADEEIAQLPEISVWVESEPAVRNLGYALVGLRTDYQSASGRFGDRHLVVLNLQTRIAALEAQLKIKRDEVLASRIQAVRAERSTILEGIRRQIAQVRTEFNEASAALRDIVSNLARAQATLEGVRMDFERSQRDAERDIAAKTDQKNRIDARLMDLRLQRERMQTLEVASFAPEPNEPSWPKWSVLVPMGAIVGIVIGLGLAFLLELIDTSIKSPSDISRRVDLPMLGMVPHSEDLEDAIADMRLAYASAPNSPVSEAFRQIRTALMFSGPAEGRRTVLVTSPMPGDGRTTVAMNLAGCIARGGRKVLVVDANFRQPGLSTLFPQAPRSGLSGALVGQCDWRQQVHSVEDNLWVLSAGPLPPNPAELLGSAQMRSLIEQMRGEYDQVIFDGAPCVVVTDSQVLGTVVDSVILIVRAGANTYGIVQRTRDMLDRVGARVIGVVLNGVRVTSGGYLRKNYETYYEYQGNLPQLPSAQA